MDARQRLCVWGQGEGREGDGGGRSEERRGGEGGGRRGEGGEGEVREGEEEG